MQLQLKQLDVQPGQRIILRDVSWDQFEQILNDLGSERSSRLAYYKETLEIMVPLPEHENGKENIGDFVKALLEEIDIEFVPFGSTTFKRQNMDAGVEPDECFYIAHEAAMRGRRRIDLNVDPPPDLAIETTFSPTFTNFPIIEVIPRYVAVSQVDGRNTAIKAFRAWVREQLQ